MNFDYRNPPLYLWRVFGVVVAWNVLILIDRLAFGFPSLGPFTLLACLLFAVLGATAPANKLPGALIVRSPEFVKRWRWVFWYIAFMALSFVVIIGWHLARRMLGMSSPF